MQYRRGRTYLPFGEALRLRRRRAGLTQRDLGRVLGVDDSTVTRWEHRNAPPANDDLLRKLASALDAQLEDLVAGAVDLERPPGAPGERWEEAGGEEGEEEYEAIREFPRLRSLLTSGWRHLSYVRKVSVISYLEYQVEMARRERRHQDRTDEGKPDPREGGTDRVSE